MTASNINILLADDNDANRLISLTILERTGYKMTSAKNGAEALSLAKLKPYDLIVLDIMMPVMDGVRAMRQLRRAEGPNQKTPVFALTAFSTPQDRQNYLRAGFDSVLPKSLRPGDMDAAIKGYIDKRALPVSHQVLVMGPEPKPHSDNESLLSRETIEHLLKIGDQGTLEAIQKRYWTSVEEQCQLIKSSLPEAMRGTDPALSEFRRAVHAIKGASGAIGLSQVAEICRELQNAPPLGIPALVSALITTISRSRPGLTEALSGTTSNQIGEAQYRDANARRG